MIGQKRRRKGNRELRKIILIITEGLETEKIYFNGFKERYCNVNIETIHGGTNPLNIVNFTIEKKLEYGIDVDNGDGVWCVFDVDDSTDREITDSVQLAFTNEICVALSNPSFELWYLLHFQDMNRFILRDECLHDLKTYIPHYTKSCYVNDLLIGNINQACARAKRLNHQHVTNGVELYCRNSNPSTQVFSLITFIQDTLRKNREIILRL